jgi:stage IV sporulation protein FB
MIRFTLFGVPVEIQPWFWLLPALIGGALGADSRQAMLIVLICMAVVFISILVHEFGHALAGRRAGGGRQRIVLHAFGGLAYNEGGRFTRNGHLSRIAWGPGAGFLLFLATVLVLAIFLSPQDARAMARASLFGKMSFTDTLHLMTFYREHPFLFSTAHYFLFINFWWTLINLLPVMPLDGGQITGLFVENRRKLHQIGLVTALIVALISLFTFGQLTAILFGFLAWQNFQAMRENRWQ